MTGDTGTSIRFALVLAMLPGGTGCRVVPDDEASSSPVEAAYVLTTVAEGLAHPWDLAFPSATEAVVTEKDGSLVRVDLESGESTALTGFPDDLDNVRHDPRDNTGLFGIALDPAYTETGWMYVAYSAGDRRATALKVVRFRLGVGNRVEEVEEILRIRPSSSDRFHYGGALLFGQDGMLYVTAGDRVYDEVDQPDTPVAQDPADMRGKIYRLRPDGTVPPDNPDFGPGAVPGLFATGIRASQGLALDPTTGAIWFSDHGSVQGDEVNLLSRGANYGWPVRTAGSYRNAGFVPPPTDAVLTDPVFGWDVTVAPTGLTFVTGGRYPGWRGDLLVPGLSAGSLWHLDVDGDRVLSAERLFPETPVRLRRARQAPDGRVYLLTDEPEGRLLRIEREIR